MNVVQALPGRTRRLISTGWLDIIVCICGMALGEILIQEALFHPVAIQSLTQLHHQISDLIHTSGGMFASNWQHGHLVQALRTMIDDEFADTFDSITWYTTNDTLELDPLFHEVVYNAAREGVRNAALHSREGQPKRALNLIIEVRCEATSLVVEVQDDGVGMTFGPHPAAAKNTGASAGTGGGLMLHSTMLVISDGELSVESPVGGGTHVVISIPV